MGGSTNIYNLSGGNGSQYVTTAGPHTGDFYAIQFLGTTQIDALTGNMDNSSALISDNHEFSNGDVIYGRFSSVTIDGSGKAILYNA
jgi:hypothetical protein|tara:strand:+ start:433 stop:693 length:261 start_codon:yes stop_codon:yes gene_type:complete